MEAEVCEWCDGEGCDECKPDKKLKLDTSDVCPECKGFKVGCSKCDAGGGFCEFCAGAGCEMCGVLPAAPIVAANFALLDSAGVDKVEQDLLAQLAEKLNISLGEADVLARSYLWDVNQAETAWLTDANQVRDKFHILPPARDGENGAAAAAAGGAKQSTPTCALCAEQLLRSEGFAAACGHWICRDCWDGTLSARVSEGESAVFTKCPAMRCTKKSCKHKPAEACKCQCAVPASAIRSLIADAKTLQTFNHLHRTAFVTHCRQMRFCPAQDCQVVAYNDKASPVVIKCSCGNQFCFACGISPHHPMPCDVAKKFVNSKDESTEILLRATTKLCPKCDKRITKPEGCNYMACSCKFAFCWLCKEDWTKHGQDHFGCAKYAEQAKLGAASAMFLEEQACIEGQRFLQSYKVYSDKFDQHATAGLKVAKLRAKMAESAVPYERIRFLLDCLDILIEAERIVQWSFALAFYLKDAGARKQLFEMQQAELIKHCTNIHDILGAPLESLLDDHRKSILNLGGLLKKYSDGTLAAMQDPAFEEIISGAMQDAKQWACVSCGHANTVMTAARCANCPACRLHGDRTCYRPDCVKARKG